MIDRIALLKRNNPHLDGWDAESPLTVGNGELAFTADITGLQSFYEEQRSAHVPLCTMSQWGWHCTPAGPERNLYYRPADVQKTAYESVRGPVWYASEPQPGNEEIYNWLRQNPHRLNLARVSLTFDQKPVHPCQVSRCSQTLDLYSGVLCSRFWLEGYEVETETVCAGSEDVLGFSVRSAVLAEGRLGVELSFPYGSKDITASDWKHPQWHKTRELNRAGRTVFLRTLDKTCYQVRLACEAPASLSRAGLHSWNLTARGDSLTFTLGFAPGAGTADCTPADGGFQKTAAENAGSDACPDIIAGRLLDRNADEEVPAVFGISDFEAARADSKRHWAAFWDTCGMIDFSGSADPRAKELERRIVLSEYLLALQSLGALPPQETGLTCNSWYGKFHLEMYPWHCGWAPLWNKPELLQGSLKWYKAHLKQAMNNAACNGYQGARWPKMTGPDAIDSPSRIAVFLIWQQPHILWMLNLVYSQTGDARLLAGFWEVIRETARFMCDFVYKNEATGFFDLPSPLIPAQEEHDPRTARNPAFELEYWRFALTLAADWADMLGKPGENWREVALHMAPLPEKDGLYLACETCPDTFERFQRDHPSMTAALGFLPGRSVDRKKMAGTIRKVLDCWDFSTMWGWDFAMLAMTFVRLGNPKAAVDILLKDTPKNSYVTSGNNYQRMRTDLPLYLPGNGSLLLAAAVMTAGYKGCGRELPGFPDDGSWQVTYENISPFPY